MINSMKFKKVYFAISLAFLLPGLFSLAVFGLKPAVDFTGGSVWEFGVESEEITLGLVAFKGQG